MAFLLDTNVVSELRRPRPDPGLAAWFGDIPGDDLYLSVLTLGEIRQGAERLRPRDPDRADAIDGWLAGLRSRFADRIVAVDAAVADRWGALNAIRPLPVIDGLLAATAITHGWTLATRNTRDFRDIDVPVINPFGS